VKEQLDDKSGRVRFGTEFLDFFSDRHANTHAAFFLDYVGPGMCILDCGCGPGSITLDLAQLVTPGKAMGIDIESAQIERARTLQRARKVGNAEFQIGDLNHLPFEDRTFDAVFAHGVVEYFRDPVHAFAEIHRVLKSGGVLGARHGDWGGFLLATKNPNTKKAFSIFIRLMKRNGGDPHFGRNQTAYLRRAGFERLISSASYDCWTPTPAIARQVGHFMKAYFASDEFVGPVLHHDLASDDTLKRIQSAFDDWGENEDIFAAEAWGESVAWKS
jgi:ubiquinone/menaquinone biosynthesis C-methylase UbiE